MKNKKGITLIALIITIIVMVILAGVAMASILPEDGVINKTEIASIEMEKNQIQEQISTCVIYGIDGKINLKQTYENVENLFREDKVILIEPTSKAEITEEITQIILTVKGNYSEYNYKVTKSSIQIFEGEIDPLPDYTQFNVGDIVYYDEDNKPETQKTEWIVYTKSEDGKIIEIISANTMYDKNGNGLTLGISDPYLTSNIKDYDCDGIAGDNKDKAIESYNNAIATINKFCEDIIIAKNSGVRSVGATAAEDKSEMYNSTYFSLYFPGKVGEESEVKGIDSYYDADFKKMKDVGGKNIVKTTNTKAYWIASRTINDTSSAMNFNVRYINSSGSDKYTYPWKMNKSESNKKVYAYDRTYGVRPIVTNPINISLEP